MRDLVSLLEEYKIEIKAHGGVLRAFCPFHKDVNKPNFTVYKQSNSWFCFSCSVGGDSAYFVAKMENISYSEAKRRLGEEVDASALMELVAGLDVPVEPLNLNMQTAFFLSPKLRNLLYTKDERDLVLSFMRELDTALSQVITPAIQAKLYKKFGELTKNIV